MNDFRKGIVLIPTYNELDNVERITGKILQYVPNIHILFIDDGSPDGTAEHIKELIKDNKNIHILERPDKMGLGSAYVSGFKFALEKGYEYIFQMDADFSHDPKELPNFIKAIEESDLVLGSRYIKGVNVINWPLSRLLLSYFANSYTRIITGLPICDATGGFKCFRRAVLESIDLNSIKSNGYAFQIEMTFKVWHKGFHVKEIPIIFIDRVYGESKLSKKIMWEAIFMVWKLRISSIFSKN
ncbi:MAG: polyprenol monophosphomannose synthase [Calditrichaceae bacterium]|nr:polyprenol monophosphomannose synthase [Calditrichaceae bacterium]